VLTRIHLRLVPHLTERVVVLLGVDDLAGAMTVGARLRHQLDELVALEVALADGIELVAQHFSLPLPFDPPAPVVLLAECAQRGRDLDALVERLGAVVARSPEVRASAVATDARTRDRFWTYREGHADAINATGVPHKLDVTLPFGALAGFEPAVRARVAAIAPEARVILFGHVGDGNLHVNVLGVPTDDTRVDDAVLDLVVELGGSISAEHGIGIAKRDALVRSTPPAELAAMRSLKQALDPEGILNPGVLFAS
jgi:FAD/FMN-containing dehydrogenase